MFSCKRVISLLYPFFPIFPFKSCVKPPPFSRLQTIVNVEFKWQCSSSAAHFSMRELVDTVALGVGSLDDMEASLERKNIRVTPTQTIQIIRTCKTFPLANCFGNGSSRSRRLLRFFLWSLRANHGLFGDDAFNYAIRVFCEMKDLAAMGIVISELQKVGARMEDDTFALVADTLVNSGKADEAVILFRNMMDNQLHLSQPYGKHNLSFITTIVHSLCSKGYARKAEGVVWHHKDKIHGNARMIINMSLLHGWCVHGNVKEAKRILQEMKSLGINPGLASYNDLLRCLCNRNLKFNPSQLVSQATDLMMEMRSSAVSPTTVSFNILLSCLSRARRVKETCSILSSMMQGAEESRPDQVTYYLVLKVLYLTKRIGKGNDIVDHMIKLGVRVEASFFRSLIGVLCGTESVKCALSMFDKMKSQCKENLGPTYDLLIEKLCRDGNFEEGRRLYDEGIKNGVILQVSKDLMDPLKMQVFKPTRPQEKLRLSKYKPKIRKQQRKFTNRSKSKC